MPHVIVTGASGYIGTRFCALAQTRGWRVTAFSRHAPSPRRPIPHAHYALEEAPPPIPGDATALVHLACHTHGTMAEQVEIQAAQALVDAARRAGVPRLVFVSSQTAANPVSRYGRVKHAIEDLFAAAGGSIVRPGLVYDGSRSAGLFATFWRLARLPIRFVPLPTPVLHPIHLDDQCEALLILADHTRPCVTRVDVGGPPIRFSALLAAMTREGSWWPRVPVPLPLALIVPFVRFGSRVLPRLAWLSERLESFGALEPIDGVRGLEALGIVPRPLHDGLHPTGRARRRDLGREGRALLRYAGGFSPGPALIARYVRAIEGREGGRALGLSRLLLKFPGLAEFRAPAPTSLLDPSLERRLTIAVILTEATPDGAQTFLAPAASSRPTLLIALAGATLIEAARRIFQLLLCPLLLRQMRHRSRSADRA